MGSVRSLRLGGTDPAAGVEIGETLTSLDQSYLEMFKVTLVTDANVATRTVRFMIQASDGTVLWSRISPATQAASLTRNYCFFANLVTDDSAFDANGFINLRVPPVKWPRGAKLVTATTNKQAGDNYATPLFFIEEIH